VLTTFCLQRNKAGYRQKVVPSISFGVKGALAFDSVRPGGF
jgi:hypothetical protein